MVCLSVLGGQCSLGGGASQLPTGLPAGWWGSHCHCDSSCKNSKLLLIYVTANKLIDDKREIISLNYLT